MRTLVDPPMDRWQPGLGPRPLRRALCQRARHPLNPSSTQEPAGPLIATGHQARLWHPGILAKDLAAAHVAKYSNSGALHVVVDHDAHDAATLPLPVAEGPRLRVEALRLGSHPADVPTGWQGPLKVGDVLDRLEAARARTVARAGVDRLAQAFERAGDCETLAQQMTRVLWRLAEPAGPLPAVVYARDLVALDGFGQLVEAMLADARRCAQGYNAALAAAPGAGLTPLAVTLDWVELPLWVVDWNRPRRRVFVDLGGRQPMLVDPAGEPIESRATLAPRALLLTAFLRSSACDLFIHGKGGGVYDRAAEAWWRRWRGQELAPMAVVSADLTLELPGSVADFSDFEAACWYAHHLPHNLDRALSLDGDGRVAEKRRLLAHMDDDRDKRRRRAAFDRLHAINAQLAAEHPGAIDRAGRQLAAAEAGLDNRAVKARRDWCVGLYPPEALGELSEALAAGAQRAQATR